MLPREPNVLDVGQIGLSCHPRPGGTYLRKVSQIMPPLTRGQVIHVRQLALSRLKAAQFLLGDKPQEKRQFALESRLQVLISRVLGVRVELSPVEDKSIRLYLNQPQLVVAQI